MTDMEALLVERERQWFDHPIILANAVLPTRSVKDAVARTLLAAIQARSSISFWADPVTGKSSCIRAIIKVLQKNYAGSGILLMEAVEDKSQAEGRLLISILKSINFAHKPHRELAEKREQVKRALIAMSGPGKRIFFIIDEAQEITDDEFGWIKAVINALSKSDIKVGTILFGQRELRERKEQLKANGRSDLYVRFLKGLREFRGVRVQEDLDVICEAMDRHSEYPSGSGWSYTQFLFPRAYDAGFRFKNISATVWERIRAMVPPSMLRKGLPMDVIASLLSHLCRDCQRLDAASFTPKEQAIDKALRAALAE